MSKTLTIIVPCFNEQDVIPLFYEEMKKVVAKLPQDTRLLFIDDGSTDQTLNVIKKLASKDSSVHFISFSRNFGKEAALIAGLKNSNSDYTAILDVDLQDPPSLLIEMTKILESEPYSAVAAYRTDRKGENKIRSFFSGQFYKLINKVSNVYVQPGARDYRLMKREMVDSIIQINEKNRFSKGLFEWVGFPTKWISYPNEERKAGETKWNNRQLFSYALDGIFNFSETPLRIASWFGIFLTVISFVFLVIIVIRKLLLGDPVAGWASTISIIIFMGGIQLFFLGILGQYLARVYTEVKERPLFFIKEQSEFINTENQ